MPRRNNRKRAASRAHRLRAIAKAARTGHESRSLADELARDRARGVLGMAPPPLPPVLVARVWRDR